MFRIIGGRLGSDMDSTRSKIESPSQNERDRKAAQHREDNKPRRPSRQTDHRKNRDRHLNNQPACDRIPRRDAINLAPPQFTQKSVEP